MIGTQLILTRKMQKSFVKKMDEDWVVYDFGGVYDPYTGYACGKLYVACVVAVTKSREDARAVARQRRGN